MAALALGATGLTWLIANAAPAMADGGQTIAAAPLIAFGTQEFGNTSNGTQDSQGYVHSYWALPVTAGDSITIDWQAPNYSSGQYPTLRIFTVGTTDYNVGGSDPYEYQDLNDNGHNERQFTAPSSGTMPVDFQSGCATCDGAPGPYEFTASVRHRVLLALTPPRTLALRGRLPVRVHDPDGARVSDAGLTVSLEVRTAHGRWVVVGHATPSSGTAGVRYTLPARDAGLHLRLRAVASGSEYTTATSSTVVVSVPARRKAAHHN